jgi:uncharacterized protein
MHARMRDIALLIQAGCSADVVAHCRKVSSKALSFADRLRDPVDRELVRLGGVFHDIGRSRTHDITHAIAGVEIGRSLGFSEQLLKIIERHVGAGITEAEARRLGLPAQDYLPLTLEEQLVSYADNLISGEREISFSEALDRFKRILGPDHEGVELFRRQHQKVQGWMKCGSTSGECGEPEYTRIGNERKWDNEQEEDR